MSSAIAEIGKEHISAAEAIEKVKALVKQRYNDDRAQADRARAEMERFAGGQTDRLDKDAIEPIVIPDEPQAPAGKKRGRR